MFSVARRAAGRSLGFARSAMEPRVVTTSATQGAAAAAAAPAMKPANMQEFQIYRWDPDTGGKPRYQTYQVRVVECAPLRRRGYPRDASPDGFCFLEAKRESFGAEDHAR